jgi:hypothetical protein
MLSVEESEIPATRVGIKGVFQFVTHKLGCDRHLWRHVYTFKVLI